MALSNLIDLFIGRNPPYQQALANNAANTVIRGHAPQPRYQGPIAYAAAITPDSSLGEIVDIALLTGALTVNAPINAVAGHRLQFIFRQDATGTRVVTLNAVFKNPPTIATAANAVTIATFVFDGTNWYGLALA